MNWIAVFAYLLDLLGSFIGEFAYIFMKKAQIKVEKTGLNGTKKRSPYRTCEWVIGFGLLFLGSIIHVVCLPFVDLVLLSTNSSIAIVMNNILSVIYLNEKVVWSYDVTAVSLIILGSLAIVFLTDYSDTTFTVDDIRTLLWSPQTLTFTIILLVFTFFTILQFRWHMRQLQNFNALANSWLDKNLKEMQKSEEQKTRGLADEIIEESTVEEVTSLERPVRLLNKIINGMPKELVAEISPYAAKYVRPIVKMPMITIMATCGICVGINLAMFTFLGELTASGSFTEALFLTIFLITLGMTASISLLIITNFVISQYDQLDAMPVYHSMGMVFSVICGLLILGEAERYSAGKLIGMSISVLVSCAGIFVLGAKHSIIASEESAKAKVVLSGDQEEDPLRDKLNEDDDESEVVTSGDDERSELDRQREKLIRMLAAGAASSADPSEEQASDLIAPIEQLTPVQKDLKQKEMERSWPSSAKSSAMDIYSLNN